VKIGGWTNPVSWNINNPTDQINHFVNNGHEVKVV